jgi:hypothetical protein
MPIPERILAILSSAACGLLFPQSCVLCNRWVVNPDWVPLCEGCAQAPRPKWGPRCDICGTPVHANFLDPGYPCSRCRKGKQPCDRIRSWGIYEGRLRELIHAFKFNGLRRLALPLASHLVQCLREDFDGLPIDALVPVPLHRARRRSRGVSRTPRSDAASNSRPSLQKNFNPFYRDASAAVSAANAMEDRRQRLFTHLQEIASRP